MLYNAPILFLGAQMTPEEEQQQTKEKRHLTLDKLKDPSFMKRSYEATEYSSYLCTDYSPELFIEMVKKGFTIMTMDYEKKGTFLLPLLLKETALLEHHELHISKNVQKLMAQKRYKLVVNKYYDPIVSGIEKAYKEDCFLNAQYTFLLYRLRKMNNDGFKFISTALVDTQTRKVVAGEIGYLINGYYTGISKFSQKDKEHKNLGTLQRVLLTHYLSKKMKIHLSDLGPAAGYEYKLALGAKEYTREAFLKRVGLHQG